MKFITTMLFVLSMPLLFVGCASKAPDCNAKESKSQVVQLTKDKYKEFADGFGRAMLGAMYQSDPNAFAKLSVELQNIRTTDFNDKTGSYACASEVKIVDSEGKTLIVPVTYRSELLADKNGDFQVTANFDFETAFANSMKGYTGTGRQAVPALSAQPSQVSPGDPCAGAATTLEINNCTAKIFADADKELNRVYKEAMSRLDTGRKAALKNEQRAWIKQKEQKCNAEANEAGGSMATSVYNECLTKITTQRTQQLQSYR